MGTSSIVAIANDDGTFDAVCVNWNGYLTGVGNILFHYYSGDQDAKRRSLIDLGDISSLGPELGEKHAFEDRETYPDWSTAYGRDRGECGVEPSRGLTRAGLMEKAEEYAAYYVYIWASRSWTYARPDDKPRRYRALKLANVKSADARYS
jgi:hypothetical protein